MPAIIWWLIIGGVAGFLASMIVNKGGEGVILDIVLGLIGSVVGGWVAGLLGIGAGGSILGSILIATGGAVLVLVIYHAVMGKKKIA